MGIRLGACLESPLVLADLAAPVAGGEESVGL